ncbi:uncharacterized protein RHTO_03856 [Rhodotorula toruloides NP11]|uniref:Uncharacterized protein n=1 Tax=Rhodotorula toruloides (strain NP11) TaxID=1130832 RepID=M7XIQ1_RHOT1|nr:uncharacterized protein RHTO_03856 [Rhodotorula toruloides NP11]EMS20058.1 hypothetical protein RHTO_03856 [Rhodotorula toruloides NP11]
MKLACDSLPLDERQNRVQLVLSPRTGMLAVDAQAGSLVKGSRLIPLLATALNWRVRRSPFKLSTKSRPFASTRRTERTRSVVAGVQDGYDRLEIRFDASSPSRSRLAFLYRPALRWICLFHQVNTRSSSKGVLRSNLAELGILCGWCRVVKSSHQDDVPESLQQDDLPRLTRATLTHPDSTGSIRRNRSPQRLRPQSRGRAVRQYRSRQLTRWAVGGLAGGMRGG